MNFEGSQPISITRYCSSCQWDDETFLPLGLARIARNVRYTAQGVASRYGNATKIQVARNNSLTGGGVLRYLAAQPGTLNLQAVETILLFAYGAGDGSIWSCPPFLQADLRELTNAAFFSNTGLSSLAGLNPVMAQAFNNLFVTLADLLLPSTQGPLVYNSDDSTLYPASDLPFGAPWTPGTYYRVGQVVSPSTFETFGQTDGQGTWVEQQTGFLYRCIQSGTSGNANSQPAWPTTYNGTVNDNTVQWQECTPIFISGLPDPAAPTFGSTTPDAGSPIANGATVYLAATLVNPKGEGINALTDINGNLSATKVLTWKNATGQAVDLSVVMPAIAPYLLPSGSLGASFGATGLNLYAFIDPTSTATDEQIVDASYYALVNTGGPVAAGATVTITAYPAGQQLPQTSTAATTNQIGNVDTGIRYLTVFGQTKTGYQTGWSNSAPQAVNVTQSGWPIQCLRLPIGPYNWEARGVAATVSGASSAGPYTYVSEADIESPGFNQANIQITATLVNDNTSTTALFNFTDTYLLGASDVTNYFDRKQIPPSVDVYFAKTLQRVVFTGAVGYQSGHLISDLQDGETVRIPGSNLQVSENDGDRTVCYREIRGIGYSFKENSGYAIETNSGDPSTWGARKIWSGTGPVGPLAIDIAGADEEGNASEFAAWAHRSGLCVFTGTSPLLMSRERLVDWETINWAYGHLVKVQIDHKRRQIHVLAPTGNSTSCNTRWVVDYFFGMEDPVIFSRMMGRLIANPRGRKWSQDDVVYNSALYIPQKSQNAVQTAGIDVGNQMVFFAADGSIKALEDGQYYDEDFDGNQVGYMSQWVGVLGQSPSRDFGKLVGARMWATGNGLCNVHAYDDNDTDYLLTDANSPFVLTPGQRTRMDIPMNYAGVTSQRWAVGFDNNGVAGAWWQIFASDLMVIPMWKGLPG